MPPFFRALASAFCVACGAGCFVQEPLLFAPPRSADETRPPGSKEICGNGIDDDGDGFADEACHADSEQQVCYTGPVITRHVGACHDGVQRRIPGDVWGPCTGAVVPSAERCGDGVDANCDGKGETGKPDDLGCCMPTGPEVCNGVDDDCQNGVDDGVLNACGKCPGEACFIGAIAEPARCDAEGRTCRGIAAADEGQALTIDTAGSAPGPDLVAGLPESGELVAIDPASLEVRWRRPGPAGARVVLLPGGAWLFDAAAPSLQRIDADGAVVCAGDLHGGLASAIAADARGRAFVAVELEGGPALLAFEPDLADPAEPVPLCRMASAAGPGTMSRRELPWLPASLAVGVAGIAWSGSEPALRIPVGGGGLGDVPHLAAGPVAVDGAGDAWFAGADLHRVLGTGPYEEVAAYQTRTGVAAAAVVRSAAAVTALAPGFLLVVDPVGPTVTPVALPAGLESGTGLTALGDVAFLVAGDKLARYTPGEGFAVVGPVPGLALRLDADGSLGGASPHTGLWTQELDGGHFATAWIQLEWLELRPPGSIVEMRVAFADRRSELAAAPRCGPFLAPPADLTVCPGSGRSRFLLLELFLGATEGAGPPVVRDLSYSTTRP